MTGAFGLFHDGNLSFGFRLKAPDGTVVAVFCPFPDKVSAVKVSVSCECAGMGLITDPCPPVSAQGVRREPHLVRTV